MSVFTQCHHDKAGSLLPELAELTSWHRESCPPYRRLLDALGRPADHTYDDLTDLPYVPVRLFKEYTLVSSQHVNGTLSSSGTTGSKLSKVPIDREAARRQRSGLASTLSEITGGRRLPLLIVDTPAAVRAERSTIRGATVLGVMTVGRDHTFALHPDGTPALQAVADFARRYAGSQFLVFGFTYLVWTWLCEEGLGADLSSGILLHTGGWKRLADRAVGRATFRQSVTDACGITSVHDFYGMVEQGGTIHLESPSGDGLYSPDFADVIIRDPLTWREAPVGVPGIIEVISTVPRAHPGHVLLTEDIGVVHGIDDGHWPGKRFSVLSRLPKAEARGCSDTMKEPLR